MPKSGKQFSHNETTEAWQETVRLENDSNLRGVVARLDRIESLMELFLAMYAEVHPNVTISTEDI